MDKFNLCPMVVQLFDELVRIRREIHMNPELLYDLPATSKLVGDYLEDLGLEVHKNVGKSGVVGVLRGEGPCILLRADMDCLRIEEANDLEYKSKNPGLMHACGHDAHTAMLLIAAKVLSKLKSQLKGSIKFLFQPAEEGGHGALAMIQDPEYPVLTSEPKVDKAFGIHVSTNHSTGDYLLSDYFMSCYSDRFDLEVIGTSGHVCSNTNNPIVIASEVILALQTIVSRNIDNKERAVISVTSFTAGQSVNAVPGQCSLRGTLRSFKTEVKNLIVKRMKEICKGTEIAHNCKVNLNIVDGYGPIINSPETNEYALNAMKKIVPNAIRDRVCELIGEDFSYFTQRVPGTFMCLGTRKEGANTPIHSPNFDIDENAMIIGSSYFVELALSLLG